MTDRLFLDEVGGPSRFVDSGMVWDGIGRARVGAIVPEGAFVSVAVDVAAALLAEVLLSRRPAVVVTYEPSGGYGHPDHVQAHRVTMRAVEIAVGRGLPQPCVLWAALDEVALRAGYEQCGQVSGAAGSFASPIRSARCRARPSPRARSTSSSRSPPCSTGSWPRWRVTGRRSRACGSPLLAGRAGPRRARGRAAERSASSRSATTSFSRCSPRSATDGRRESSDASAGLRECLYGDRRADAHGSRPRAGVRVVRRRGGHRGDRDGDPPVGPALGARRRARHRARRRRARPRVDRLGWGSSPSAWASRRRPDCSARAGQEGT